jgi:uncharacterized protein
VTAVYVDSSVLLLAAGADHPDRRWAVDHLDVRHGRTHHASVECVQEFLFHRMRRVSRDRALEQAEAVMAGLVLHDFTTEVLVRSFDLVRATTVRGRDAVHAATALVAGVSTLITADRRFQQVPGLTVLHP